MIKTKTNFNILHIQLLIDFILFDVNKLLGVFFFFLIKQRAVSKVVKTRLLS